MKEYTGTVKKIVDTAIELLKKEGYENVSVNEICKAAGVSRSSFYNIFSGKNDIIIYMLSFAEWDMENIMSSFLTADNDFERMWMLQSGVYLSGSHYRCMMLLYKLRDDEKGMEAQYNTWMKQLPDDFICKFVCDTPPEFDKTTALTESKDGIGQLSFSDAIMQALSWNWDYLFIGTDSLAVHPERLEKCLSTAGDKTGHVRIFNGKPFYMIQAGFILSRTAVTSIPIQDRSLRNISAIATVELHDLDFVPFHQYKKEGAEWVTLGSMTPEEILSLEA